MPLNPSASMYDETSAHSHAMEACETDETGTRESDAYVADAEYVESAESSEPCVTDVQHKSRPVLWIVVPCYNEQEVLPVTAPLFLRKIQQLIADGKIADQSVVCFVDDGSSDKTWSIIQNFAKQDSHCVGISLSRNRGHQNALLAGLMEARLYADVTVSMDCDGQDDINAIDEMLAKYKVGAEIVYGVRSSRDTDTAFKRMSAEAFYKLLDKMGVETVFNHADYRLMGRAALDALSEYKEVNLFLRGMIPQLGFQSETVEYERTARKAGESHYPLSKMCALALNGITSYSIKPIRFISGLGIAVAIVGLIGIIWAIVSVATGSNVTGWASTICIICLLGGVQLLALGVIGEYIGKIYLEVKGRPRYIVEKRTWDK